MGSYAPRYIFVKASPPTVKEFLYSRENLESGDWSRGEWTPRVELATANQDKIARVVFVFLFIYFRTS